MFWGYSKWWQICVFQAWTENCHKILESENHVKFIEECVMCTERKNCQNKPESKKKKTVKKFRAQLSVKKVMLTAFWNMKVPLNIDLIEKAANVCSASYCQISLQNSPRELPIALWLTCSIVVSAFELQSSSLVYFRTNTLWIVMNLLIPWAMGKIISILFFYKDRFDRK